MSDTDIAQGKLTQIVTSRAIKKLNAILQQLASILESNGIPVNYPDADQEVLVAFSRLREIVLKNSKAKFVTKELEELFAKLDSVQEILDDM